MTIAPFSALKQTKAYFKQTQADLRVKKAYDYRSDAGQAGRHQSIFQSWKGFLQGDNIMAWWERRGVLNPQIDAYRAGDLSLMADIQETIANLFRSFINLMTHNSQPTQEHNEDADYAKALDLLNEKQFEKLASWIQENPDAVFSYDNKNPPIYLLAQCQGLDEGRVKALKPAGIPEEEEYRFYGHHDLVAFLDKLGLDPQ